MRRSVLATAVAALLFGAAGNASAADLRFGITIGPSTIDPHFHNLFSNNGMLPNIYEPLVGIDADGKLVPALAESWRIVDTNEWEFKLRQNVKFHDGTPFVAEDVAFSINRVKTIPNSPGSMAVYVRQVKEVKTVDANTIRITTSEPTPYLLWDLANLLIRSSKTQRDATTSEINAGPGAIGTGPYKNVKFVANTEWVVARNPDWWGPKQAWDNVSFKTIPSDAPRLAAFMAGDLDVIQGVSLTTIGQLEKDSRFAIYKKTAMQSFWLVPDTAREVSPFVLDDKDQPLAKNPLLDVRVRKALLMSIDRAAIVDRVLGGYGEVAHQIASTVAEDYSPVTPVPYDPEGARKLLAEAGYPNGFTMVLHGSTGVIAMDDQIAQAVGQYFARVGIKARVETAPANVLYPRATRKETSFYFSGTPTPNAAAPLRNTSMTPNPQRGTGSSNRLAYSNPTFDALMNQVLTEMDTPKRRALLAQATKVLTDDVSVIPLFHVVYTWAARKGVAAYKPAVLLMNQGVLATPGG
jgi:peptide/nickel transport system substrate-binding protein